MVVVPGEIDKIRFQLPVDIVHVPHFLKVQDSWTQIGLDYQMFTDHRVCLFPFSSSLLPRSLIMIMDRLKDCFILCWYIFENLSRALNDNMNS